MNISRWKEIESVFFESLNYPEPERGLFLDLVCGGDHSLRLEVEALIQNDGGGDFLSKLFEIAFDLWKEEAGGALPEENPDGATSCPV